LPNEKKILAMLTGELTISAKYCSTFAKVSVADCMADCKGTFETENSNKWKPWNYKQRVNVVNKVDAF